MHLTGVKAHAAAPLCLNFPSWCAEQPAATHRLLTESAQEVLKQQ